MQGAMHVTEVQTGTDKNELFGLPYFPLYVRYKLVEADDYRTYIRYLKVGR